MNGTAAMGDQVLRLKERWSATFSEDAPYDEVDVCGDDLITRWSEPFRRYHTLDHLERMLDVVDDHGAHSEDPQAVALACWFHDAIYDPTRLDNELESAELARAILPALHVEPSETVRLVLVTVRHEVTPGDRNAALLCDADLAILATDPATYARYAEQVREEYAHVSADLFRVRRAEILRRYLDRPEIYHVPEIRRGWERRARANLSAELDALGDVAPIR